MGGIESQPPGDARENPSMKRSPQEFCVRVWKRDIFMSHILAVLQPQLYSRSYTPLSRKKRAPESGRQSLPDWAIQIGKLKDGQRLTQVALAAKMNVSQPTVSDWLAGRKEPKPEIYFRMARIWPQA